MRYISSKHNLKAMMNLLIDKSKNIQVCECSKVIFYVSCHGSFLLYEPPNKQVEDSTIRALTFLCRSSLCWIVNRVSFFNALYLNGCPSFLLP